MTGCFIYISHPMKEILDFITELKENNNREWFDANKQRYLSVKAQHENFIDKVIEGIRSIDPQIGKLEAKDCVFRIYRDVRFSPNKEPYKNHIGAYISRGGRKSPRAGYYIHLDPGASFAGGGIYMPSPDVLKKIRNEIYFNTDEFKSILESKEFKKNFTGLYEDKLSRPPKDFDASHPGIEYLKYKSFFVEKAFSDNDVMSATFVRKLTDSFRVLQPMNDFLNKVFD